MENQSTEDAMTTKFHTALTNLEKHNGEMRMLFVDFSSTFSIIIPHKVFNKLNILS